MLRLSRNLLFLLVVGAPMPAFAALNVGQAAPDFTAAATLGGKPFTFSLSQALKQGPVVLYFYPAAFTQGCTVEAHEFALAMPQFAAAGASVIGISVTISRPSIVFRSVSARASFPSLRMQTARS